MGYHTTEIKKGILGEFSKIKEEFEELKDAHEQENSILELCEICDLLGAIEAYTSKHNNVGMNDLYKMTCATKQAFMDGSRK